MTPCRTFAALALLSLAVGCTQESQNRIGRSIQNWTGTDGVLKIDKLTTASGTDSGIERPYRFGYGVLDTDMNGTADKGEKKVYFEFSDYSTSYVFYESPN